MSAERLAAANFVRTDVKHRLIKRNGSRTGPRAVFSFFYPAVTTLYEFEPPHSRGSKITHKDAHSR